MMDQLRGEISALRKLFNERKAEAQKAESRYKWTEEDTVRVAGTAVAATAALMTGAGDVAQANIRMGAPRQAGVDQRSKSPQRSCLHPSDATRAPRMVEVLAVSSPGKQAPRTATNLFSATAPSVSDASMEEALTEIVTSLENTLPAAVSQTAAATVKQALGSGGRDTLNSSGHGLVAAMVWNAPERHLGQGGGGSEHARAQGSVSMAGGFGHSPIMSPTRAHPGTQHHPTQVSAAPPTVPPPQGPRMSRFGDGGRSSLIDNFAASQSRSAVVPQGGLPPEAQSPLLLGGRQLPNAAVPVVRGAQTSLVPRGGFDAQTWRL